MLEKFIALAVGLLMFSNNALANGFLDPSFASTGKTATYWPIDESGLRGATFPVKTLVQNDNKVLVISNTPTPFGSQWPGNSLIGISRLNANGSEDSSYGFGGLGQTLLDAGVDFEVQAVDALLRPDGVLIVLGTIFGPFDESNMALWAVLPNGQLDNTFGSNGFTRIKRQGAFTPSDQAGAITLSVGLPIFFENNLVVAGGFRNGNSGPHDLMELFLDGQTGVLSCDSPVCGNEIGGNAGLPNEWRYFRQAISTADVQVADLVASTGTGNVELRIRALLRRANADANGDFDTYVVGTYTGLTPFRMDSGFGGSGYLPFFFSAAPGLRHNTGNSLALHQLSFGDERLVIAGYAADAANNDAAIGVYRVRMNSGAADTSFNGGVPKVFDYQTPFVHGDAYAQDVLVQPWDGKVLIGGGYEYIGFVVGDAALMRLNFDGSFDNSFGNLSANIPGRMGYGHTLNGSDRDNRLTSMTLSADGEHLVFSGYAYSSNDGSYFGSVMRAKLYATELLKDSFE